MVYNILQVENDDVYIAPCHVLGYTTTEHAFVYIINHTKLMGKVAKSYYGTLIYNWKESLIRFI